MLKYQSAMTLAYALHIARLSAIATLFGLLMVITFRLIVLIISGLTDEEKHGDE